ncbi:MAG: hypothetical protein [Bacteriophage sp.]|nr:MAG: hypothetical protein [Bacteriophage sp.]
MKEHKVTSLYISTELLERVKKEAEKEGRKTSNMITRILESYFNGENK